MTQPIVRDLIYCGHVYDADVFDLYVQWYVSFRQACMTGSAVV